MAAIPGADPVYSQRSLYLPLHQPSSVSPDVEIFLATKTLDGGSGRGEGTRQPVATKPVASLPAAGGTGNFCLGRRAQCDGLSGSGLHGVIDLFPSPSPPLPPLSPAGYIAFPNWAQAGCNKELPLPHPRVPSPSVGASPRQKGTVEGAD